MKVNLQSVNFNVDQKLVNFIQAKLDILEYHFNRIFHADVFLLLFDYFVESCRCVLSSQIP